MKVYQDLLKAVYYKGIDKEDRTGTGTRSLFGYQMRFDLKEGFPLVTTKKTPFSLIKSELLFFLRGETNNNSLQQDGCNIWNEWGDTSGNLGPIYGHQWRGWGGKKENIPQPEPQLPTGIVANVHGVGYIKDRKNDEDCIFTQWRGVIARCYSKKDDSYKYYGGRGVSVCNRWLVFENYKEDIHLLDGWQDRKNNPNNYHLDKDIIGSGFLYAPESCCWVSRSANISAIRDIKYTVKHTSGEEREFKSQTRFIEEFKLQQGNFSAMLRGERISCGGWSLVSKTDNTKGIDQIANVIQQLKSNPDSRRLIVSAWNVADVEAGEMALPPCHILFQFYTRVLSLDERMKLYTKDLGFTLKAQAGLTVEDEVLHKEIDKLRVPRRALSCQLYQRSADSFLGVPFNIASYALLTSMIAQCVNMVPDEFIWAGGDTHIYHNHFDQVEECLKNEPRDLCKLVLNESITDIDDFGMDDIKVIDYISAPHISAPVAV